MPKPHKIVNYSSKNNPFGRGPRRTPWKAILGVLVVVGLVFLGISIYPVVSDYFSGNISPSPLPDPISTPSLPEPEPSVLGQSEQAPSPQKLRTPQGVQGVLLPYDIAVDPVKLDTFLAALPAGTNTLYFEGKDNQGHLYFETANPDALVWGAVVQNPVALTDLSAKLKAQNLSLAVKFSVFSDPIAARGNIANAVMHTSGVIWIDNTLAAGGRPWLTPFAQGGRDYQLALLGELADQGADLFILSEVQFPQDPTRSGVFGEPQSLSRQDQLVRFLEDTKTAAGEIPVGLLLTTPMMEDDTGNQERFGGDPANFTPDFFVLSTTADAPLPAQLTGKTVVLFLPTAQGAPADHQYFTAAF